MKKNGVIYQGKFCPIWGGLYWDNSEAFYHGGLEDISRCVKTKDSCAVLTEETIEIQGDMKKPKLEILKRLEDGWLLCRQGERTFKRRYRIRKLTPRTCFRLMGVRDEDIDAIQGTDISESQQYKLAGNSIVVPVLEALFTQMFTSERDCLF